MNLNSKYFDGIRIKADDASVEEDQGPVEFDGKKHQDGAEMGAGRGA